jgi:Ribonuclease G/E
MGSVMITGRVDEIWIAVGPEMSRVMFLTAGTVVEIWHEFTAVPHCIGEVHQLKIDQVFGGQNRATARLEDGTPVSLRVTPRDKLQAGQSMTATIIAAPRQGKPWQAAIGARLVGTHVVLLPGDAGFYASRALPDDQVEPLRDSLAEKLPRGYGAILRRAVAGQEASLVGDELTMLVHLWQDRVQATGCIHDGGTLSQKAALHAPGAAIRMTGDALPADGFDAAYDAALDAASGVSVDLASGGRLWFEPTQALVAIDLDSGGGGLEALLREAPPMIAYQLRLRALSGLIAIDVPRLSSGAAKTFTTALAAALATDPRQPEILGRTRGGMLECRIAHGRPSLDSQRHFADCATG